MPKNKKIIYGILVIAVIMTIGVIYFLLCEPCQAPCYWLKKNHCLTDITGKPQQSQQVTITTDKTEYKAGEQVIITTKNNFKTAIAIDGNSMWFWENIEQFDEKENQWEHLTTVNREYRQDTPLDAQLPSNQERIVSWNQEFGPIWWPYQAGTGKYRIRSKIKEAEIIRTVYSNEFSIINNEGGISCTHFTSLFSLEMDDKEVPQKGLEVGFASPYTGQYLEKIEIDQKIWPGCTAYYSEKENRFWILDSSNPERPFWWFGPYYKGYPCLTK